MTTISLLYHRPSDTFIAEDDFGNQITFKSDREQLAIAQNSTGKSVGPMLSLLMACGACSGIDIVMILDKQRQNFDQLTMKVSGEREKNVTPALWKNVEIAYYLQGEIDPIKTQRAAELSVTKYCSVLETLRRAGAEINYKVYLNSNLIK